MRFQEEKVVTKILGHVTYSEGQISGDQTARVLGWCQRQRRSGRWKHREDKDEGRDGNIGTPRHASIGLFLSICPFLLPVLLPLPDFPASTSFVIHLGAFSLFFAFSNLVVSPNPFFSAHLSLLELLLDWPLTVHCGERLASLLRSFCLTSHSGNKAKVLIPLLISCCSNNFLKMFYVLP